MPRPAPNIALAVLAVTVVVAANAFLLHGALGHWVAGVTGRVLAPVTGRVTWLKEYTGALTGRFDVAAERLRLEQQQRELDARTAEIDQLKHDVDFYTKAAGIRERLGREPVRAGAFSWPRQGGVRELVVNRGTADWVAPEDVVVTADGALVGIVREAFSGHATVTALGDIGLEVTARVVGTNVSGLVRADGDGLLLDLVQKGEAVTEGQLVVTSGDDRFPAGMTVGTIRSVDMQSATLFAPVRITASAPQPYGGAVLIIRP